MNHPDFVRKFQSALPAVKKWIQTTLDKYGSQAVSVVNLDFTRIKKVFSDEVLSNARVVAVHGDVPFPPLSRLGLTEFLQMENMHIAGITYNNTFFVNQLHQTDESLYFHELVHVIQWNRLGVDNFLLVYGVSLMAFGYEDSPFEKMAYSLQANFEKNKLSEDIVGVIQKGTDDIWQGVRDEIKHTSNGQNQS